MLLRRSELYNASALGQLKPEHIKSELDGVSRQIYEADHEEEIEAIERTAKGKLADMKKPRPPVKRTRRMKPKKRKRSI